MLERIDDWLRRAHELLDGRPADEQLGHEHRPGLVEHRAMLTEQRARSKPRTDDEAREERAAHPEFARLQALRAQLEWSRHLLGLMPCPDAEKVEAQLAREMLPDDAAALIELAWGLVDDSKDATGQEQRAHALVRRALPVVRDIDRARPRDTLAWTPSRLGRFDEALVEMEAVLREPDGAALRSSSDALRRSAASWRGERRARIPEQEREIAELETHVAERRNFAYEDPEGAWWDRQLARLVAELEAFGDAETGLVGDTLAAGFGWGVIKRREWARTIRERSIDVDSARQAWDAAIAAIRSSPSIGGLELAPQLGLLPIGPDPGSGL